MTENEALNIMMSYKLGRGCKPRYPDTVLDEAFAVAISALKEVQQYREIGTVEQVKNQKENLNVAYQIINDYEQYGTIEDFKMAQRYMRLVKSHGTIGQVINSCAEYEEIGTVEECREAVEKQKAKKTEYINGGISVCKECGHKLKRCYDYCPECGQAITWKESEEE